MPSDSSSLNSTYSSVNSLQAYGENAYNLQLPNRIDMSNAASHNIISNNALNINKLRKNLSQLITSAPHQSPHEGNSHFFPAGSSCDAYQNDGDSEGYNLTGSNGHNYSPGYIIEEPLQVSISLLYLFFHFVLLPFLFGFFLCFVLLFCLTQLVFSFCTLFNFQFVRLSSVLISFCLFYFSSPPPC
jgi:hypothetical protein